MRTRHQEECKCPLCGRLALSVKLKPGQLRIECREKCSTYEISETLERILLSGDPEEKGLAPYLSDAAQRATHGAGPNFLRFCLQLTEDGTKEGYYVKVAAEERGFQDLVQPVVKYLDGVKCLNGGEIKVTGKGEHSFVYLELLLPEGHRVTLKVESSLFRDRSPEEFEGYCRGVNIAAKLEKTARGGTLEIDRSAPIGSRLRDEQTTDV